MAFQPETNAWVSGVYQWETTDPAQGGLGGVMNTPLLQLSSRTLWLKGQVETLATSISSSASLNSPAFIGNPTAPTAAQFDNDTSIATTAFVQRALGNFAAFDAYSSSQTLVAAQAGRQINFWGGSAATFVLPAASTVPAGGAFWITNSGAGALTVQRAGADQLIGVGGATTVAVSPGDSLCICSLGYSGQWIVFGGSAQLQYSTALTNKANTSGTYAGLNVGYATSSGNADTVDGWHRDDIRSFPNLINKPAGADIPFNWSGQPGQPAWLWGGNDAGNTYVYNPSNFSVAYAASAGSAPVSTAQVLAANAGATAGAVGTYIFGTINGTAIYVGSVYSGSTIIPSGVYATGSLPPGSAASGTQSALVTGGSYLSGSWIAMGELAVSPSSTYARAMLFLRIA